MYTLSKCNKCEVKIKKHLRPISWQYSTRNIRTESNRLESNDFIPYSLTQFQSTCSHFHCREDMYKSWFTEYNFTERVNRNSGLNQATPYSSYTDLCINTILGYLRSIKKLSTTCTWNSLSTPNFLMLSQVHYLVIAHCSLSNRPAQANVLQPCTGVEF